jgi:hypothetical protein
LLFLYMKIIHYYFLFKNAKKFCAY